MVFQESDLQFTFSDIHWEIKRYDAHRYFKILSGAGLKGVDFIGIHQQQSIVFFEVKHFHTNHSTQIPTYQIFEDTPTFIEGIVAKMEDTATAVQVIIRYLKRKWWYRLFLRWQQLFPVAFFKNRDWFFWHRVNQLLNNKQQVSVLWLEIDHQHAPFPRKKIKKKIVSSLVTALFAFGGKVEVADKSNPVYKDSLVVS